jgi:WD40 repeat protein
VLRSSTNYENRIIESSCILESTDAIVASYDGDVQRRRLHFAGSSGDVRFVGRVVAMACDEAAGVVWVSSGPAVRSFDLDTLREGRTITTGCKRSPRGALAFWAGRLAVGAGSTVQSLSPHALADDDVCLTLPFLPITALAAAGDALVVASAEHHTPHVYAQNGALVSRAMGHVAGVTALAHYSVGQFLTGSADQTAKLWDVRQAVQAATICKHGGVVTAVFGAPAANVIATGGTDGVVYGWDLRRPGNALFVTPIGENAPQTLHYSNQQQCLTVVVSERISNMFYDLQKFDSRAEYEQVPDGPTPGVLSFHFRMPD